MSSNSIEEVIALLIAFGGGKGGEPGNVAVRFLLPTFFWAGLAFVSFRQWKKINEKRDQYIGIASLMGIGRELLMFISEYGSFRGLVDFKLLYGLYPPMEHAATMLTYIFTGAAFINYCTGLQRFARRFFAAGITATLILYAISAFQWPLFLKAHARVSFAFFWGDMAFRISASLMLGLVLTALIQEHIRGRRVQKTLMIGFFCWFLDEFLMIMNIATLEQYVGIYAPIRHNLHIWAIPIFLGVYWNELAHSLIMALGEAQQEKLKAEAIIAGIGDGVTIQDRNFKILYQNLAHKEFSGDHTGKYCYKAYAKRETLCDDCPLEFSFQDGSIHRTERVSHTRQGIRYFEVTVSPLKDPSGQIIAGIELVRDVTERTNAAAALKKSKAFSRRILDTVEEGFVVIDREYKIVSANRAYLDQANLPPEEVVGKYCYSVSHHSDRPCYERGEDCALKNTFETGNSASTEHTHIDSDGREISVEITSYPLKDDTGRVISAIEVIKNITEKRKLEDQLRHAQKMEAVGHLAGGIAHDFNNILSAIIGFGTLMKMKMADDDPQKNRLMHILDSADRATNLTQSLLAFSRKQVLNPQPVDLNNIIAGIEKLVRRLIGEEIELCISLAERDLIVKADSGQIGQILMNLATNARDAITERGSLTICSELIFLDSNFISQYGTGRSGTYALLSVEDTGSGMDIKTRENIFEPFFTTKEVGKGTGLGLSVVYGIVKQHNGFITCDSEPGKGTIFKVYLPVIEQALETLKPEMALPVRGGNETILLAEDDATLRTFMKELLNQYGYSVIETADGNDAVSKFMKDPEKVHLLILDVMMPNKNGKEAYEEMRKFRPEIKALFTSGYAADIIHKKGILDEGLHFISKPASPAVLMEKVRSVLNEDKT